MTDWIVPGWPAPPNVQALVTTRGGGFSGPPFDTWNLADHVGDDPAAVAANRARLAPLLPGAPRWLAQVHGIECIRADAVAGRTEADASWTGTPGVVCVVLTADCLPVLFCDREGTVVAAAHAGWRGLLAGVLESTVGALGRAPEELMAWLGPAIGPSAFEVGPEVRSGFVEGCPEDAAAFLSGRSGRWWGDLYALARRRLRDAGVQDVFGGGFCTASDEARFFSYRRDGATGRMAALVWLDR